MNLIYSHVDPRQTETEKWFQEEVFPHEPFLRAWLRSRVDDLAEVDDLIQETFLRMIRVHSSGMVRSPKALLFTTARRLLISRFRKKVRQGQFSLADFEELGVLDEDEGIAAAAIRSEELDFLTQAMQSLPARCRQILTLRKIYGMPQAEIARELGISVNTVETQAAIGMKKLTAYFGRMGKSTY